MKPVKNQSGFTLIEVVLVIIIFGILAAVVWQSGKSLFTTAKTEKDKQELESLAFAITGNPELQNDGVRTDFGYVGDVGSLPPDLDALYANPGSYTTWNGPYVKNRFSQVGDDYKYDVSRQPYQYSGGTTITTQGGDLVRSMANSIDDLLYNQVKGNVYDFDGTPPGNDYRDSINITITYPNGAGGMTSKNSLTDAGGYFEFDSIPIGRHNIEIVFSSYNDTLDDFVTITPGSAVYSEYRLSQNYWSSDITAGLVGHWKLDETSGLIAHDASGSGLHGTLVNMAGSEWTTGKINNALDFNGSNQCIRIGNTLSLTTNFTVTAWVKPSSVGTDNQIVSKGHDGVITQWELKTTSSSGRVSFRFWAPGEVGVQSVSNLSTGVWTHLAGTYDGTTWRIYWNGVLDNENVDGPAIATSEDIYIGAVSVSGNPIQFWPGLIDDVRIYNRVLSPAEIAILAHPQGT